MKFSLFLLAITKPSPESICFLFPSLRLTSPIHLSITLFSLFLSKQVDEKTGSGLNEKNIEGPFAPWKKEGIFGGCDSAPLYYLCYLSFMKIIFIRKIA